MQRCPAASDPARNNDDSYDQHDCERDSCHGVSETELSGKPVNDRLSMCKEELNLCAPGRLRRPSWCFSTFSAWAMAVAAQHFHAVRRPAVALADVASVVAVEQQGLLVGRTLPPVRSDIMPAHQYTESDDTVPAARS
jgi:hypothetical protein